MKELKAEWDKDAKKNNVYPLYDVGVATGTTVSKDYTRTKGNELRDHVTKVTVTMDD